MSGVGTPGDDGQQPWSFRPGGPAEDPHGQQYGAFAPHTQAPTPQQPFAPQPQQPFGGDQPDWSALAEQRDAKARRRRVLFAIGGAVVALAVVGGIAFAVLSTSEDEGKAAAETSESAPAPFDPAKPSFKPAPTVPPAPEATAILADPRLDTAPFTVASLFPTNKFTVNGRQYTVEASKAANTCSDGTDTKLGPAMRNQQCTQIIRLAVTCPDGIVATAAAASFPTPAKATAVMNGKDGGILLPLPGGNVKALNPKTQSYGATRNATGRYGLFTLGWHANGKDATPPDAPLDQALDDLDKFLRTSLLQRGEAQAKHIDDENRKKALEQVKG